MTDPNPAQQLGERYAAVVGAVDWQVDDIPEAPESPSPEASSVGVETPQVAHRAGSPPLAEPVNEPTVPPTPLQIIEALLFVGGPALTAEQAADTLRGLEPEQFHDCIDALNRLYRAQNRPYAIVHGATGAVLRVARKHAAIRERLYGGPREARLNQPALDVLALIAYRQPVAKAEIDGARGAESGGILRQLARLGLVTSGPGDDGAVVFQTTARFMEVFRLRNLDDLPELGEPRRIP
jgi:segregation and condensation protein B